MFIRCSVGYKTFNISLLYITPVLATLTVEASRLPLSVNGEYALALDEMSLLPLSVNIGIRRDVTLGL